MDIPFLDLKTPHQELENELVEVFREALRSASFIGGPQVEAFEKEFADYCGTAHCVAVKSGTDALRFALLAAGIGPGDEVITVPNTFIATTEAISQTGASIAFVDIDERTFNMDPNRLEDYVKAKRNCAAAGPRPKAVVPVHLYGQPADMDSILDVARCYDLLVIEDACQAHGALHFSWQEDKWKRAGSIGLAGAFSFYPGKNLGACGEGGAVTTNHPEIARKIRMLRDHGQARKYYHEMEGYNGRLDAIQCAFLRVKLRFLEEWNQKRREAAARYKTLLGKVRGLLCPHEPLWAKSVYHLYVIRTQHREGLQKFLSGHGIGTGLHYPIPLHLQKAYAGLGFLPGSFPRAEKASAEILSLPMFPGITPDQQARVAALVQEFFSEKLNGKKGVALSV